MTRSLVGLLFVIVLCLGTNLPVATETPAPASTAASVPKPTVSTNPPASVTDRPAPSGGKGKCGDGVCSGPENATNCSQDCASNSQAQPTPASQPPSGEKAVLYVGVMIHLEGWKDDQNQGRFKEHAAVMREYASLFEKYGAKLTWESKEVTDGSLKWGDNVLLEMQQRGHGVGVHADIGGEADYDCSRFADDLRREKEQLESLGVTVMHVSGNTSHCDWVTATADAGYLFTTGQVAYNVMSMPEASRPAEYRNCPSPAKCHDPFPPNLADRIHPWRMNTGADWLTYDPNGRLVLLPSGGGGLPERTESIDNSIAQLEQAIALSEAGKVNTYYVGRSIGQAVELPVVEAWLQRIQPYVESGQVQWMNFQEMYEAYVAWEKSQ